MNTRIHELKIKRNYYRDVLRGIKTFEVRKNDRGFKLGDFLALNEIDDEGQYTGCSVLVEIIYILNDVDSDYVKEGMVILGIKRCRIVGENDVTDINCRHLDPDEWSEARM